MGKTKVPRKYIDAYYKDLERLLNKYDELTATIKAKPGDQKAKAELKKLEPFLAPKSLEARRKKAAEMDGADLDKIVGTFSF